MFTFSPIVASPRYARWPAFDPAPSRVFFSSTKFPTRAPAQISDSGRICANGPMATPSAIRAPTTRQWSSTVTSSPNSESTMRTPAWMTALAPTVVRPRSETPGRNHRVRADHHVFAHVGRRGVFERDARRHQGNAPRLPHPLAHGRELSPRVDAEDFFGAIDGVRSHPAPRPPVDSDQVGEVILLLRIVRGHLAERREQRLEVERVDARVDLSDLSLAGRRVPLLDDAEDLVAIADDPAVAERVVHDGGQHRSGRARFLVARQQGAQRAGREQGYVAREEHQGSADAGEQRLSLHHRVRGSQLGLLEDEPEIRVRGQRRAQQVGLVADDYGPGGRAE